MTRHHSEQRGTDEPLPPSELDRAVATPAPEGRVDDPTGGDAGAEQAFGDAMR